MTTALESTVRGGRLDGYNANICIGLKGPPTPSDPPLHGPGIDPPKAWNEVPRPSRTIPGSTQTRRTTNINTKTPPDVHHEYVEQSLQ